ncbi:MAG: hypothetical protein JNN08_19815 [Bryobacterales bacterium]|nr:hypothetical protein [Bryobacterales bacterium]
MWRPWKADTSLREEITGRTKILGVDVVQLTFDDGIARGRVWLAPSLNCEVLQEDIEIVDRISGRLTRTTTKLDLGEPPTELFEIPREFHARGPVGNTPK